jgi:hypothetical protein
MHPLPVAADAGVELAVEKENIQNHGLDALLMVEGLVRQAADILQDLGADSLVPASSSPRGVRVVGERVDREGGELLRVPDEAQVLLAQGDVGRAAGAGEGGPLLGGGRIPPEQEGLPADGAQASCAGAAGAVELDGALEVSDAGAVFEGSIPARSVVRFSISDRTSPRQGRAAHFASASDLMML